MFNPRNQCVKGPGALCRNLPPLFILLLLSVPRSLSAQAPAIQWVDCDSFRVGYQWDNASDTLTASSKVDLKLYLDTDVSCLGVTFDLDFGSGIGADLDLPQTLPATSFLGSASQLTASYQSGEDQWTVLRNDTCTQLGNDKVLTLHLEVGNEDILRSSAVQALGGIITVENFDLKRAWPETETTVPLPYPNPSQGWIRMAHAQPLPYQLYQAGGRLIDAGTLPPGQALDLRQLPPGVYWWTVELESGPHTFRIILQ